MLGDVIFGTNISYGWGMFDRIGRIIREKNIVLVLGRDSARSLGLEGRMREQIDGEISVFSGVEPNPSASTVERGARFIRESDPEAVIAAGGGSVMDAAKFMGVIAKHGGSVVEYIRRERVPHDSGYPLYAVPTTPGTSSEITPFSVVTVPEMKNKFGLRHPSIYPRKAVIDPSLTVSLPANQTASTGLDILSHAMESYWSRNATPLTREFSLNSVRLVRGNLKDAFDDGSSKKAREGISLAGIFAGLGFSNTGTTICHSISYPVTVDTGLPHGMACALTLGPTFDLLSAKGAEGMEDLAAAFGSTIVNLRDDLTSLMRSMKVPVNLEQAGFTGGADRIMSTDMSGYRSNLAVRVTDQDLRGIIDSISG